MFCTNCGQRLTDDANFCGHCGQRIIQPDLASISETVKDLVTDKAEDIVIQDDNLSSCDNLKNDDVAQKASYIGEISYSKTSNIPNSVQRKNEPQYIETHSLFLVDYLIIKRENTSTHSVSYCLLNTISNNQSEWFDCINYCGYGTFYIERGGLKGLMEDSFGNYQLWDQMSNSERGYYCVAKDDKWAVVTIRHKRIEQVTAYEYDYFSPFIEGAAIVKQNGKYGYLLYDKDTNKMRMLPRVLDDAKEFVITTKCVADVIYQGKSYEMDKKGNLYEKEKLERNWVEIIGTAFFIWLFLVVGVGVLYNYVFNEMSLDEAYHAQISFDAPTVIIALVTAISALMLSIKYHKQDDIYVLKMNIASSKTNDK